MIVVADTSPLLHLARIGWLDLIPAVVGRALPHCHKTSPLINVHSEPTAAQLRLQHALLLAEKAITSRCSASSQPSKHANSICSGITRPL